MPFQKAFDVCVDKDEVCKKIHTNLRDELGSIPTYLFSRAVAGKDATWSKILFNRT